MSRKRQFFKNGILLTLVALSMRGVGLFSSSYVAGAVGAEGVGLYTLIMSLYGFALTFATSGISLTMTNQVAAAQGEEARAVSSVVRAGVTYALIFGGAATTVLFLFAPLFGGAVLGDVRTVPAIRILALSLLPEALLAVLTGYFVGVRRIKNNAVLQVSAQAFKLAITVLLVGRIGGRGIKEACVALAVCLVLTDMVTLAIAAVQFLHARRGGAYGAAGEAFVPVCRMAFPLAISAYLRSALLTVEHLLIPKRLRLYGQSAADSLASYGVLHGMALPVVLYPMALLTSFAGLLVPEFAESGAKGDSARMQRMCEKSLCTALWYGIGIAAFLLLLSEELGLVFYHSAEAGRYIAMLAPVVPIMYLDHVTDQMLKGIGEQVASMWINITDSLLSVVLVYVLLPILGVQGYAWMIIGMETYNFLLSFRRLRRRIRFRLSSLLSVAPPFFAALFSVHACDHLFLMNGSVTRLPWMLLKILFCFSAYVGTSAFLSLVTDKIPLKKLFERRGGAKIAKKAEKT